MPLFVRGDDFRDFRFRVCCDDDPIPLCGSKESLFVGITIECKSRKTKQGALALIIISNYFSVIVSTLTAAQTVQKAQCFDLFQLLPGHFWRLCTHKHPRRLKLCSNICLSSGQTLVTERHNTSIHRGTIVQFTLNENCTVVYYLLLFDISAFVI